MKQQTQTLGQTGNRAGFFIDAAVELVFYLARQDR
jgi:hypothetical protein